MLESHFRILVVEKQDLVVCILDRNFRQLLNLDLNEMLMPMSDKQQHENLIRITSLFILESCRVHVPERVQVDYSLVQ